jgi:arginine:ornithine antiporter/lysine permease
LALKMTSSMTLFPYLLVAAFGVKLAWTGATYAAGHPGATGRTADGLRAAVATVYAAGMLYAGGPTFLLLAAVLYAPGTLLYFIAMREQGVRIFRPAEMMLFAVVVAAALAAVWGMAIGTIAV